ncbi:hypothetical protein CBS101457_005737 [Exobasidium rhododendri]|nr:hypothetical protein CBS101457_005737 [Exobasidium rhododendri]
MSKPGMGRALTGGAVLIAVGYGIMKATTPTDEQFYNKLSPALKKQVDMQRQAGERQLAYAEQLKRAREQEEEQPLLPIIKK